MKIVTFTGLDGSGKSTQLKLLKTRLESLEEKVAIFHATEFSLANKCSRFFKKEKRFIPGNEPAIIKATPFFIFLRKIFLFSDILRFHQFKKKLEQADTTYLISDRYFYDTVINILYLDSDSDSPFSKKGLDIIESFIPRPDIAFYFDITPEEIMRRDRVPEQGIEYLEKKFDILEQKKEAWSLISLDASKEKNVFAQEIYEEIRERK